MASYLDKEGLSTFLDCLREEELAPIQNDVSNLSRRLAYIEEILYECEVTPDADGTYTLLTPAASRIDREEDGANTLTLYNMEVEREADGSLTLTI